MIKSAFAGFLLLWLVHLGATAQPEANIEHQNSQTLQFQADFLPKQSCAEPSGFRQRAIHYAMWLVVIILFPLWAYLTFVWLFKFCRGYYRWRMGDPAGLRLFEFSGDSHLTRRQRGANVWLFAIIISVSLYPLGFMALTLTYFSITTSLLCIR